MKLKINKKFVRLITVSVLLITSALILYLGNKYSPLLQKKLDNNIFSPVPGGDNYSLLLNTLAEQNINAVNFTFTGSDSVEASLSSGTKVIFSLNKDVIEQAASLQLILSRFRIEGRKVNKIDLRFKNAFIE